MIKKIIIAVVAIVLVIMAVLKLAHNKSQIDKETTYKEVIENVPVNTLTVQNTTLDNQMAFVGTFHASKEATVSAEAAGKIVNVSVTEGNFVNEGQVIAELDKTLLQLQLQNNEAEYAHSQEDLVRYENLIRRDGTTDAILKQMRLNNTINEIAVKNTKEQIARCSIKAPITGYLISKNFEKGTVVSTGVTIGQVVNIGTLKFTAMIPEYQVVKFELNQKVNISADVFVGAEFIGTITQIAEKGDDNHNYKVEATVANSNQQYPLKAAMNGTMHTNGNDKKNGIFIPREALTGTTAQPQVYLAVGNKAVLKNVTVGCVIGNMVNITEGISTGEQVIVTGLNSLKNGVSIVVKTPG